MKIAINGLPAGQYRQIFIAKPNIYCGQTLTMHVFMPTGSDGITYKAYVQYNNYGKTGTNGPTTVTTNAFNTTTLTIPSDVGPGGIQRIGVQIYNNRASPDGGADGGTGDAGDGGTDAATAPSTDFTGNVYLDAVTWP